MKKTIFAVAAFMSAGAALANPFDRFEQPAPAARAAFSYELSVTNHRETYEEFIDGDKVMQEKAWMTGVKGGITRTLGDTGGAVVVTGEYALGKAKYTGSYQDGNYGDLHFSGLDRSLIEVTGMYKHTAPVWNGVTAGLGLGYRRLVDNLQDAGPAGYKRTNERSYLILSVEKAVQVQNWTIVPGVQYKHLLSSKQSSDLGQRVTVKQPDGFGAEMSISFVRKGDGSSTAITPYFRVWDIKDSETDRLGLYEPRNKTQEVGVALTYKF